VTSSGVQGGECTAVRKGGYDCYTQTNDEVIEDMAKGPSPKKIAAKHAKNYRKCAGSVKIIIGALRLAL